MCFATYRFSPSRKSTWMEEGEIWNKIFPTLKYASKLKFKFIPVYYKVYFQTRILKDILGILFFPAIVLTDQTNI